MNTNLLDPTTAKNIIEEILYYHFKSPFDIQIKKIIDDNIIEGSFEKGGQHYTFSHDYDKGKTIIHKGEFGE